MRRIVIAFVAPLFAMATGALVAASAPQHPQQEIRVLEDLPELKPLKYRSIGPAWGGRVTRVAGVAGDPNTCYAAAASGGVWKSADGGSPEADSTTSRCRRLARSPSPSTRTVHASTGEANIRGNVAAGSTHRPIDAGKTWTHAWKQEARLAPSSSIKAGRGGHAAVLGKAFGRT
jgi:hypothetical protein